MKGWNILVLLLASVSMVFTPLNQVVGFELPATAVHQEVQEVQNINIAIIKNNPYDQISVNTCSLMNNIWGAPKDETGDSGVYLNSDGAFGWYWDRPNPVIKTGAKSVLPIYPSIRIGGNRWERTKSAPFPLKLGEVNSLTFDIEYQYLIDPTGCYDLAYDMFLSDPAQTDSAPNIKAEVMIWLDGSQKQPKQHFKGIISDGNNSFALYSWVMTDGRTYYSFILQDGQPQQGCYAIDGKKLLDQLGLEPGLLIHGIEFGNEVWNGSGKIEISQFSITLNDKEI
jgi:hypothetical protein